MSVRPKKQLAPVGVAHILSIFLCIQKLPRKMSEDISVPKVQSNNALICQ